jgi:hypothetical protein
MASGILFSPTYLDAEGAYGRDFYWEQTGFGRIRKLAASVPIAEVQYIDDPNLGTATYKDLAGIGHDEIMNSIDSIRSAEQGVMAGRLIATRKEQ